MQKFTLRRNFLKAGVLSSAVILTNACNVLGVTTSRDTIKVVQNDLFPKAKELGIDTSSYISIVYRQHKIAQSDKDFLKNGVKWLNETAMQQHKLTYTKLSAIKRQELLKNIVQTEWGSAWVDNMMRYIFEAMLGDPIYGGNQNQAGWKWLAFEGGKPRAKRIYL
jgi:gluconate 2-dehydrogenase gamma chain